MSYGILVKSADDVPAKLLEEFEISKDLIIYRGTECEPKVASYFVEISKRIE